MHHDLIPGDVLLYKATGFYGKVIALKTWHNIGHVEVYIGESRSAASRDRKGVGLYPVRFADLAYVLRPIVPFQLRAALDWFHRDANGLPYGWADLLFFAGLNINRKGIVCSPFATQFLRAGGVPVFNKEMAERIAPFQFQTSELLAQVWSAEHGFATPEEAV
jgi:hypothetical protein